MAICRVGGDGSSASHQREQRSHRGGKREAMGLPRGSLKGSHPGVPSKRLAPLSLWFFKVGEEVLQGLGVYRCCFSSLLVFTLATGGNTESRCCRFAGGLLGGPGGLWLSSWPRAGTTAWEKQKTQPLSLFPLFSLFSHHQPANHMYGAEPALRAGLARGGGHPKRQHPSPHLNKLV